MRSFFFGFCWADGKSLESSLSYRVSITTSRGLFFRWPRNVKHTPLNMLTLISCSGWIVFSENARRGVLIFFWLPFVRESNTVVALISPSLLHIWYLRTTFSVTFFPSVFFENKFKVRFLDIYGRTAFFCVQCSVSFLFWFPFWYGSSIERAIYPSFFSWQKFSRICLVGFMFCNQSALHSWLIDLGGCNLELSLDALADDGVSYGVYRGRSGGLAQRVCGALTGQSTAAGTGRWGRRLGLGPRGEAHSAVQCLRRGRALR